MPGSQQPISTWDSIKVQDKIFCLNLLLTSSENALELLMLCSAQDQALKLKEEMGIRTPVVRSKSNNYTTRPRWHSCFHDSFSDIDVIKPGHVIMH